MKLKKLIAMVAAAAMSVAAFAIPTSAAADVIDFEDGDFSFVTMKTDDGGDVSVLSVADQAGSKMLKVELADQTLIPKIKFDVEALLAPENRPLVNSITYDVVIAAKDGATAIGWNGGAAGTAGENNENPGWSESSWTVEEYTNPVSAVTPLKKTFLLPAHKFTADEGTGAHFLVMMWANANCFVDIYIDNIKFLDADGNAIALKGAAAAATTDAATTAPQTGNAPIAIAAAVVVVAGAMMVATRKRK